MVPFERLQSVRPLTVVEGELLEVRERRMKEGAEGKDDEKRLSLSGEGHSLQGS
jgi:hypothetical protein